MKFGSLNHRRGVIIVPQVGNRFREVQHGHIKKNPRGTGKIVEVNLETRRIVVEFSSTNNLGRRSSYLFSGMIDHPEGGYKIIPV